MTKRLKKFKWTELILFSAFITALLWGTQCCLADTSTDVTQPGGTIVGIPIGSSWPSNESPQNAIDNNINTKYLNFSKENSGFRVQASLSNTVVGLTFTTANDAPDRDPVSFQLSGSNISIDGPYTLIAEGNIVDFSQSSAWPRFTKNATPILFSNTQSYLYYQLTFPALRNSAAANSVQIAEVELLGIPQGGWPPVVDAGPDQIVVLPYSRVKLAGDVQVFDQLDLSTVQTEWTLVSAPEGVAFQDLIFEPNQYIADPNVIFPALSGQYELSLTASTPNHNISDSAHLVVSMSLCPVGDLSRDCRVDSQDLLILAESWLKASAFVQMMDLGGQDGNVDFLDFAVMAENWSSYGPKTVITEFLANNTAKPPLESYEIVDDDGDASDWIELCNPFKEAVNLEGWYLTDDPEDLTLWEIPSLVLEPQEFCIIFASGKDRKTPGDPYHTNFKISSSPNFLALIEPDGKTIAHRFSYPSQYGALSYGLASPDGQPAESVELISSGTQVIALVPSDSTLGLSWTAPEFVPTGWQTGTTAVGYETGTGYENLIGLDIKGMYGVNASVYIRIPFQVNDLTGLQDLALGMMYDDGFVAYLNGSLIASANAPAVPAWNSIAETDRPDSLAVQYQWFPLSNEQLGYLRKGQNVLSIHGLNKGRSSSDFLILPRLTAVRYNDVSITSLVEAYFQTPTPGYKNNAGQMNLGPMVRDVTRNPVPPLESQDLLITAKVSATARPVGEVNMVYCVNFANEVTVPMNDDGQTPDAVAGDGIYSARIPASAYTAGDMVRWAVTAKDLGTSLTREPAYLLPDNSAKYFGTIVQDPSIQTNLQVFKYYVKDLAAEGTETGTRCSVFFLNEFYDNVAIELRGGNYTHGRKIHFNDGDHFLFDPAYERVDEINLNEQGADPTYLRPSLSFETYAQAGLPCSIVFPLRIIRNGEINYIRVFVEQPDRHLLRRVGLDDNGAFYKVYSDLSTEIPDTRPDEQVERKITRLYEDNSDLLALRAGVGTGNPNRGIYLFDNINIPAVINYLAVCVLIHENDHTHKNYFLYRDTNNTGEWMFIPWDKDLTFGLNSGISGIIADRDWPEDSYRSPSHPFFGSQFHQKNDYQWNRLFDAVFCDPVSRQMYLRRLRTLMDTYLQAPGTPAAQLYYEKRIDELAPLLVYEGISNLTTNLNAIKNAYLPVRRTHLYVNHLHGSTWPDDPAGIPDAQPAQFPLQIGTIEFNPASWDQDQEYIEIINPNTFAADISGWKVKNGVSHTFTPGTVIPAGGKLYLTPNAIAFRSRTTAPTGGQHLFVQGNYSGHLSSWGETVEIYNTAEELVVAKTYEGNPSDQQRYLRITELMYHPSAFSGAAYTDDEYEYIELTNSGSTSLSLAGSAFTAGIQYAFAGDVQLSPGEYLILAKNPTAFAARFSVPQGVQVLGGYEGQLSNGGETIKLEDQTHSTILEFTYNDKWYTITDGQGFSLVFSGDLKGSLDIWNLKSSWRASTVYGGSPGQAEQGLASDSIVINELLAHSHAGASDWIELYNTTDQDINIGGWFLTDDNTDMDTIRKYEIPADTLLPANDYLVFYQESSFGSETLPPEKRFALSEGGETVYLYSGLDGQVTGSYLTRQSFGASETGISFGRYILSDANEHDFTAMSENTPEDENAYPKIGPIVISEILYHPPAGGAYDKDEYEFIELRNITDSPVALYESEDSVVPWQITDGVQFTFPIGVTIPAGQRIVVVKNIDAFTSRYPAVPTDKIFGPYEGKLDNAGEAVELAKPGDEENGVRYYIRVDRVHYSDGSHPAGSDPWPTAADGGGMSLTRIADSLYGNDVINWTATGPTPAQ